MNKQHNNAALALTPSDAANVPFYSTTTKQHTQSVGMPPAPYKSTTSYKPFNIDDHNQQNIKFFKSSAVTKSPSKHDLENDKYYLREEVQKKGHLMEPDLNSPNLILRSNYDSITAVPINSRQPMNP